MSTAAFGWQPSEIEAALKEAIKRSTTDMKFRKLALENPNEAIAQVSGKAVPTGTKIRFVENEGAHFTIILPDPKPADISELSDAELEQVAGGGRCAFTCAASCMVTTTASAGIPGVGSIVSV